MQALLLGGSPAMRAVLAGPAGLQQLCSQLRLLAAAAELRKAGPVPDGHLNSDLSPTTCHIGLGRRRDLSLRQDLQLWQNNQPFSLAHVFKGKKVILVGFPGGPICVEKHIPGYVQAAEVLSSKGVDKVVCVTVDDPAAVHALAQKDTLKNSRVDIYADKNGGFVRLLGLELGSLDAPGPKCQRYAAVVEDGVLLKLRVESEPKNLQVSDVASMTKLWECIYQPETPKP